MTSDIGSDPVPSVDGRSGSNRGTPARGLCIEVDGCTHQIKIHGDTAHFERAGEVLTLPLKVILASVALLSEHRPSPTAGSVDLGVNPNRQPKPARANYSWLIAEDAKLRQGYAAGHTVQGLARIHGRTNGAIRARLEKLGLANSDDRQAELFS